MGDVRRLIVMGLAVIACNYDATAHGSGAGTSSGSGPGSGEGDTTVASTSGSGTTATSVATGSGGSTTAVEPTGTTASETDGSSGEPLPTARSCAGILEEDPSAVTGPHSVLRERDGAVVEVWCEMDVDGGGWTLVARSESGSDVAFGWGVGHGMVGDESAPYSLDVMDLGLPFTEVLIGVRTGFATLVDNAYVIEVPAGFVEDYRDQAYESSGARTVLGDCNPQGGPDMLEWLGHTDDTENYFFRDFPENHQWGLFSREIRTFYDDCNRGGDLDEEQGALFVR